MDAETALTPAPVGVTPVTVITGFLGAGKSTLLQHVLHERHGRRIAVIQNELGEGGALPEQVTIASETGDRFDEWVELPNGCLCCNVRDKLTMALEALMERQGQFDYVLIETTGVANPGALASTFWLDDALESRLMLDGIVTLVDAANVLRHVSEEAPLGKVNEVVQQIAYADRIILNKTDLVPSAERLDAIERTVRAINSLAPVVRSEHARVDLDAILGTRSFQTERALEVIIPVQSPGGGAGAAAVGSEHAIAVQTCTLRSRGRLELEPFKTWLCDLLWERGGELTVFRMKGLLHFSGDPRPHALQAVHEVWDLKPCAPAAAGGGGEAGGGADAAVAAEGAEEGAQPSNQLVVIASNLDTAALEREFLACMAAS
ncbi:CobW/HypB/UreG, nucleotide-binding domain-containing protein [Pavlovales sp. CCMP2436]|nr:CobW/HypB/UreG, nucleotide-binding domain-containing protein [Pavlovales sp. CCMP2436]